MPDKEDKTMDQMDPEVSGHSSGSEEKNPQFITEVVTNPDSTPPEETSKDPRVVSHSHIQPGSDREPPSSSSENPTSANTMEQNMQSEAAGAETKLPEKEEELDPEFFGEAKSKKNGSKLIPVLIGVCLVLAATAAYFSLKENRSQAQIASLNQKLAKAQGPDDQEVLQKVTAMAKLSQTESPMIVTVTDSSKLKESSSLFAAAADGDKLVIAGKKVILYRPKDNKILVTGTVTFALQGTNETSATASAKLEKPRFVLRNGTTINALTKKYESTLKNAVKDAVIVARENAKKTDYAKTIIVDLTGKQDDMLQTIAAQLSIEVGDLPEGESKPTNADFLLILGTDAG